ncbi:MAG: SDR family oxidoreductase [Spirochaetaceae bacterium]|nr:MAG: SDR family oxidoreductase [Spirochaetaceae bacterium]
MSDENRYLREMFGLSDSVAVITGGAGAIAGSLAAALLKAGAKVALWGHHQSTIDEALIRLRSEIQGAGDRLFGYQVDTGSEQAVQTAIAATEEAFGAPNLLINGVGGNRGKCPFVEQDMETFEFVLRLNLVAGLMVPTKVFASYWIGKKIEGVIINMTSMASYVPLSGVWAYDAAKAGVLNLTQASAKEFASNRIRVNAIAPGFFVGKQNRALLYDEKTGELTERGRAIIAHTPYGRFGETDELAGALLFLASSKASGFVTGISLAVDGGYLIDNI